jgi:hypothetical protein
MNMLKSFMIFAYCSFYLCNAPNTLAFKFWILQLFQNYVGLEVAMQIITKDDHKILIPLILKIILINSQQPPFIVEPLDVRSFELKSLDF